MLLTALKAILGILLIPVLFARLSREERGERADFGAKFENVLLRPGELAPGVRDPCYGLLDEFGDRPVDVLGNVLVRMVDS